MVCIYGISKPENSGKPYLCFEGTQHSLQGGSYDTELQGLVVSCS